MQEENILWAPIIPKREYISQNTNFLLSANEVDNYRFSTSNEDNFVLSSDNEDNSFYLEDDDEDEQEFILCSRLRENNSFTKVIEKAQSDFYVKNENLVSRS